MLRKLLLSTAGTLALAVAAVGLQRAADAAPMLAISVYDDGAQIGSTVTSVTGFAFFSGADANFSDVQISAQGADILLSPALSTTALEATASSALAGPHWLEVDVEQTGLDSFTGNLFATGTYNALVGNPLGANESTYVNGVSVDSETLLPPVADFGPVELAVDTLTADAQAYEFGFDAPFQGASGTMQLLTISTDVPEPGTLAVFGALLIAAGFYWQGRNHGNIGPAN